MSKYISIHSIAGHVTGVPNIKLVKLNDA